MFKRKIEKYLKEWKSDEHKMPLIIKDVANAERHSLYSILPIRIMSMLCILTFSSTQNTSRYLMVAWTSIFSA